MEAFRKRQNIRLREAKEDVLGYFRQVLTETSKCATSIELRTIFRDVSEKLSDLGLSLGGSEDWADRLYIEDRKGGLLFSDEELDTAEEAQKRMEVMYNVDAWTSQLASRINSAQLLLEVGHAIPHEELLQKALRRVEEDLRYHTELMDDPSSQFILSRIGDLGLPCEVAALADELLVKLSALFSLAVHELSTIVSTCAQIKIKAMRGAAAAKVSSSINKVRALLGPLQRRGVHVDSTEQELLQNLDAQIKFHVPSDQDNDSDDGEYY
ncbi:MAG: hypothetical protein SGPRY_006630 [Prymnesium sp.]